MKASIQSSWEVRKDSEVVLLAFESGSFQWSALKFLRMVK